MEIDTSEPRTFACLPNEILEPILKDVIQSDMYVIPTRPYSNSKLQDYHKFPFASKQCTAFGKSTGRLGSVYQKLLGDHIYYHAPEVYINVKDLKFTSARAFLSCLANSPEPKFAEFLVTSPNKRGISIFHLATRSFPDTFDGLLSFDKFVKSLESKQGAPVHLNTYHELVPSLDDAVDSKKGVLIERLVCKMHGTESLGREFDLAFAALKRYHSGKMDEIRALRLEEQARRCRRRQWVAAHNALRDAPNVYASGRGRIFEYSDGDINMEDEEENNAVVQQQPVGLYLPPPPAMIQADPQAPLPAVNFADFITHAFAGSNQA